MSAKAVILGVVMTYDGQSYTATQLGETRAKMLEEVHAETAQGTLTLIDEMILTMHINDLRKKSNKSQEDIERELFEPKYHSREELRAWFDKNRDKFPKAYSFDLVSYEIRKILDRELREKQERELIAKLKKQGKFKLVRKEID